MRRVGLLLVLLALVGSACGKYGPPHRSVARPHTTAPVATTDPEEAQEQEKSP